MEKIINPTKARANLFALIKDTNRDSQPVIIAGAKDDQSAVLISKRDYDAIQETMALALNGQLKDVQERQNDESVDLDKMMREIDHEQ